MKLLGSIIWLVFTFALNTSAIWLLWGWHIAPLGLPAVSFMHAAGLSAFVAVFQAKPSPADIRAASDLSLLPGGATVETVGRAVWALTVIMAVAIGWAVK